MVRYKRKERHSKQLHLIIRAEKTEKLCVLDTYSNEPNSKLADDSLISSGSQVQVLLSRLREIAQLVEHV